MTTKAATETQCTGCGATVTVQHGFLADSGGSNICPNGTPGNCLHWISALPPVAIAPEPQHTPKWETNKIIYPAGQDVSFEVLDESGDIVCQTIMREVATEKERIAVDAQRIKLFAAAPDMLSALKELVRMVGGTLQGYGVLEAPMKAAQAAISRAEGGKQ